MRPSGVFRFLLIFIILTSTVALADPTQVILTQNDSQALFTALGKGFEQRPVSDPADPSRVITTVTFSSSDSAVNISCKNSVKGTILENTDCICRFDEAAVDPAVTQIKVNPGDGLVNAKLLNNEDAEPIAKKVVGNNPPAGFPPSMRPFVTSELVEIQLVGGGKVSLPRLRLECFLSGPVYQFSYSCRIRAAKN